MVHQNTDTIDDSGTWVQLDQARVSRGSEVVRAALLDYLREMEKEDPFEPPVLMLFYTLAIFAHAVAHTVNYTPETAAENLDLFYAQAKAIIDNENPF